MSKQNQSIHPRVVDGRTEHDKVNTCGTRKDNNKIINTLSNLKEHLRIHPKDTLSINNFKRVSNLLKNT